MPLLQPGLRAGTGCRLRETHGVHRMLRAHDHDEHDDEHHDDEHDHDPAAHHHQQHDDEQHDDEHGPAHDDEHDDHDAMP